MSDLVATNCGCGNDNNNGCCSSLIWIILILALCGNGSSFSNDGCGCGNSIWIILLLLCCCNDGGGCGSFFIKIFSGKRRPYLGRLFIMLSSSLFSGIPTIVFSFFVLFTVHTFFSLHFLFPQAFLIHFKTFISTQDQSSHISIFLQVFSYYLILTFKIRHIVNKKRLWKMNLFLFMTTVYKIRK